MTNQLQQWLERAVECWDDDEFESADTAVAIAEGFQRLYMLELRTQELTMMRERHRVEVIKRMRAEAELEAASRKRQGLDSEPW